MQMHELSDGIMKEVRIIGTCPLFLQLVDVLDTMAFIDCTLQGWLIHETK